MSYLESESSLPKLSDDLAPVCVLGKPPRISHIRWSKLLLQLWKIQRYHKAATEFCSDLMYSKLWCLNPTVNLTSGCACETELKRGRLTPDVGGTIPAAGEAANWIASRIFLPDCGYNVPAASCSSHHVFPNMMDCIVKLWAKRNPSFHQVFTLAMRKATNIQAIIKTRLVTFMANLMEQFYI